jgi:hypothetical protein
MEIKPKVLESMRIARWMGLSFEEWLNTTIEEDFNNE